MLKKNNEGLIQKIYGSEDDETEFEEAIEDTEVIIDS